MQSHKKEIAKVGDTILITNPGCKGFFNKTFVIVDYDNSAGSYKSESVFFKSDELTYNIHREDYKIVKQANPDPDKLCPDCKGTGTIELFTTTQECNCKKVKDGC